MTKVLLIFALCVVGTLAESSPKIARNAFELIRMQQHLKSVDGDIAACAKILAGTVANALFANYLSLVGCTEECAGELVALQEEITIVVEGLVQDVEEQIAAFQACGDDQTCKADVVKEIAEIISATIKDLKEIVNKHLTILEDKFPEAAECARASFQTFAETLKAAEEDFVTCLKN